MESISLQILQQKEEVYQLLSLIHSISHYENGVVKIMNSESISIRITSEIGGDSIEMGAIGSTT